MNLLEGIDKVDWGNLSHAYGVASDVPKDLIALLSHEEDDYKQAIHNLFGSIWHQGTVYEATRYAVPFLIELLNSEELIMYVRISIVGLLDSIADGNSYILVHCPTAEKFYGRFDQNENYEERLSKELSNVALARKAVLDGMDIFLSLLAHTNREFTCNIFMLLSGFNEESESLFNIFKGRYELEKNIEIKNAILESIRAIPVRDQFKIEFLQGIHQRETDIELRSIAALGLIQEQKHAHDDNVMDTVLEFVKQNEETEDVCELPSWKYVDEFKIISVRSISDAIVQLSDTQNLSSFIQFIEVIQDPMDVCEYVHGLFFYLFPIYPLRDIFESRSRKADKWFFRFGVRGMEKAEILETIPHQYKTAIKMILKMDRFWEVESNFLNIYGLPHSKEELNKLLI